MPDLTISLTPAQASRVANALGTRLGLLTTELPPQPRAATLEEAHAFLLNFLKQVVKEEELRATVIPEL